VRNANGNRLAHAGSRGDGGGTREAFAAQVVRDRKARGIIRDMKIVAE